MTQEWNSRYLAYCKSQGRTPRDQSAFDEDEYPGGRMTGYILWLRDRWSEFIAIHKCKDSEQVRLKLGASCDMMFDLWLKNREQA